ncbi:hypothetical protein ACHAPT_010947 [Fusarium lateritium]
MNGTTPNAMPETTQLTSPSQLSPNEAEGNQSAMQPRDEAAALISCNRWKLEQDQPSINKNFDPVGQHAIVQLWNNSTGPLRQDILRALYGVAWTAIDILRVGDERQKEALGEEDGHPVTLLISVEPGSTPSQLVQRVAMDCRKILLLHGISDVPIEIKESRVFESASGPSAAPATAPKLSPMEVWTGGKDVEEVENNALFADCLGLSIAPYSQPTHEGTKGLYLRRKDTGTILLLTCRHVAFGESVPNDEYRHDRNTGSWTIIQPGEETFSERKGDLERRIRYRASSVARLEKGSDIPKWIEDVDAELQRLKKAIPHFEQRLRRLQELGDPASRIIGHVVLSPPYSLGTTKMSARQLRDWALIELHQGKHAIDLASLSNQVFVGDKALDDWISSTPSPVGDANWMEMRDPKSVTPPWGPTMVVMKHGRTTGFTVGFANEALSLVRRTHGGVTFECEEWCVLGSMDWRGEGPRQAFSAAGDSGSCVFDSMGRVVGILAGGGGEEFHNDPTYVTPIEWLLDDIRAHGYDVELLPRSSDRPQIEC